MFIFGLFDKRKTNRIYNPIPVTCQILDPQNNTIETKMAMAKDLSLGGIYFELNETLPLNTKIKTTFQLPRSSNIIQAAVRVVRVETTEYKDIFGIGVRFDEIEDKDKEEIKQLIERLNIGKLLELAINKGASDVHLMVNHPLVLRIHGKIEIVGASKFSPEDIAKLLYSIMSKEQIRKFEREKELDFGIQYDIENRFRVNLHLQKGFLEAALRLINTKVPSFDELNLPEIVKELSGLKDGLILVTGPTGSGKTTTIAAMVDFINHQRREVIITLERPIEYVYIDDKSIIKQREIGIDTNSFSIALKSSLRQDPNTIIIGELDDVETIRTAMIAAEAGYLVIASFHAPNTMQAIDRLAGIFPSENRKAILSQLANCLKGVISQFLIPRKNKEGRVLASEIVIVNDAVRRVIRSDELIQLPNIIQTGASYKMQLMSDSVRKYLEQDIIDPEVASFYSKEFLKFSH